MRLRAVYESHSYQVSNASTDISFNLIIFFMVSAVFVADLGLFVRLPDKDSVPLELEPEKVVTIKVGTGGTFEINGLPVYAASLETALATAYAHAPGLVTIVESEAGVTYQEILSVLETARKSGGDTFSLVSLRGDPLPVEIPEKADERD